MAEINSTINFPAPNFTGDGMSGLFTYANTVTSGVFGTSILFMVYAIAFISLKNYTVIRAHTSASFITLIVTILLFLSNIVPAFYLPIVTVIYTVPLIVLAIRGGN